MLNRSCYSEFVAIFLLVLLLCSGCASAQLLQSKDIAVHVVNAIEIDSLEAASSHSISISIEQAYPDDMELELRVCRHRGNDVPEQDVAYFGVNLYKGKERHSKLLSIFSRAARTGEETPYDSLSILIDKDMLSDLEISLFYTERDGVDPSENRSLFQIEFANLASELFSEEYFFRDEPECGDSGHFWPVLPGDDLGQQQP